MYKNSLSHIAITTSINVVLRAIIIISSKEYSPTNAKNTKKKFSIELHNIVDILFLSHNFLSLNSFF